MKRQWILILVFLLLICGTLPVQAQSSETGTTISFPRFVASAGFNSGLVLFNPNTKAASVELTLNDRNGLPLGAQTTVSVPAGGQIVASASQLFPGTASIDASLRVHSSSPGIAAQFQTYDADATFMDGATGTAESFESIFPVIPETDAAQTEISLLNDNTRDTLVRLKLRKSDGTTLADATARVPAGGSYRNTLQDLFPSASDFTGASHIVAVSAPRNIVSPPQTVSGTSLFFADYSDLTALNAIPVADTFSSGAIPFFQTSSPFFLTLSIANIENSASTVSVTAIGSNGISLGTKALQISANGGFRQSLDTLFPALAFKDGGWVLLQSPGRIAATLLYGRQDTGAFSAIQMQKTPQLDFVFPQIVQGSGFSTQLTLANPGPADCNVEIFVVKSNGLTSAAGEIVLAAGTGISRRLDQYLPELELIPGNVLYVRASAPLFAAAALWMDSGAAVTTIPPQAAPETYDPAPLTEFAVTGTVTLNELPVEDIPVLLTGPNGIQTVQTREDGMFMFAGLPKGQYSLFVDQYGFQFFPSPVTFELTTVSFRQDFQGFLSDTGILVVPASIPAGSPDTTVTIYGSGFSDASQVFSGPVRFKTSYVSPTELRVVLLAYMFEKPGAFEIRVVDDFRASDPYPMIVFMQRPQLASIKPARDIVEGSPDATITLSGSGFLDGALVKINGMSDGITINRKSDTEIIAVVPASYFTEGGVYPVTVENPFPATVESNVQLLTVYFPRPALESIYPEIVPEKLEDGSGPLTMTISGYGFRRGALVLFEGIPVPTFYCEDSPACTTELLTASIDPSLLRSSGFKRITVKNPDPALAPSQILYLRVESLQPTITSVLPGSATLLPIPPTIVEDEDGNIIEVNSYKLPILVFGTNFDPNAEARVFRLEATELPDFSKVDEVISSNQLLYMMEVTHPDSLGTWVIQIKNPQPGGGITEVTSNAQFTLTEGSFVPNPFLISISPDTVFSGDPSFTLTVNGSNFVEGSQIIFYSSPLATTFISSTELTAEVPASLIKTPGKKPITVINPDNGGTSNKVFIQVD